MRISSQRGYSFTTTEEREIGRGVKEKLCFIAFDFDTEPKSTAESSNKKQTHVLSDGNNITVGAECIRRESVFPAKCHWQRSQQSPRHFFSHITKCTVDFQFFFTHVVLSNGTTMFQRIVDRSCPVLTVARRGPSGDPNAVGFWFVVARRSLLGGPSAVFAFSRCLDVNRESRSRCGLSCGTNLS